jgi:hypothetical protein
MGEFINDLKVEYLDGKRWRVVEDFTFVYQRKDKQHTITVPKGFITDFASIPRWLWLISGTVGKYNKAAVLHDYLYEAQIMSRLDSDRLYRKMMIPILPAWKVWAAYHVVRGVSWYHWNKYKNNK